MNKEKLENIFSKERVAKYFEYTNNNDLKAINLYLLNIEISQSLYPLLSVSETALRNSINRSMKQYFKLDNWFDELNKSEITIELFIEVTSGKEIIESRNEIINNGKLTAELTFGFWTRLFNSKYENILWKPLRLAFPNLPKNKRQRKTISIPLNNIRNFRNRIYHYEPIIWNINNISNLINDCYNLLSWIDSDLPDFIRDLDFTTDILQDILLFNK